MAKFGRKVVAMPENKGIPERIMSERCTEYTDYTMSHELFFVWYSVWIRVIREIRVQMRYL